MSADRNKTDLTLAITEHAARWLEEIGAKCIEAEVAIARKWVADLAAYWRPTPTEATRQRLIQRARPYENTDECRAHHAERLAVYRALPEILTVLVEVKTSRADFKRDANDKFKRPPVADIQILAMPHNLLRAAEWPEGWWLLGFEEGNLDNVDVLQRDIRPTDMTQKLNFVAAVGERRHNRTANAFWTDLAKRHRLKDAERLKSLEKTWPASAR